MKPTLPKAFANPSSEYRAKPFWAWNGDLAEAELRRQIRVMKQMGLGGFFMHSRVGLATPYLSPKWFELVNACIDEARRRKMEAWLYDEDRWPSGAAGGLVTRNPRFSMRRLVMETVASAREICSDWKIVAVFSARVRGLSTYEVVRLNPRRHLKAPGTGRTLFVFHVTTEPSSNWFNGYTYLDTLSHAAVREFIRTTHAAYRRHCGKYFGRVVPGIFTDEPHIGGKFSPQAPTGGCSIPWTSALPAIFRRRYGYDLLPHLLELFFDVDGQVTTPARYHYHECLSFLFCDAFARQIGAWCARAGLKFTGHLLMEDTLSSQSNMAGDCMRFYEYMQAPGMDLLTEHWRIYAVAKQVSSVARQFGRPWRLTETYGCTGWDFPLEGHKALGDWQTALGINLRCPHLAWYTMDGQAKRDYPAAIGYQSPWWNTYAQVENYFARVGLVMSQGQEVRDLLVIHPVESVWAISRKDGSARPDIRAFDDLFVALTQNLLEHQLDFDYGSEAILARHARVRRSPQGPELVVGRARYRAVLVPPLKTMRGTTLTLLKRFRALGGQIVFAGKPAEYVEGRSSTAPSQLMADCVHTKSFSGAGLTRPLDRFCRRVDIYDVAHRTVPSALYLLREDPQAFYLFICNTSHTKDQRRIKDVFADVMVRARPVAYPQVFIAGFAQCRGSPQEWDPETGKVFAAKARRLNNGRWEIATSLERLGSRLFVIPKKITTPSLRLRPVLRTIAARQVRPAGWAVTLSEPNVLVLDRCRYRIGNGAWQPETEILRVDRAVRQALGLAPRGGDMVQPWAQKKEPDRKTVPVELVYTIRVKQTPRSAMTLALEHPERFSISLNARPLPVPRQTHWWVDRSLRTIPLAAKRLKRGENELRLRCDYDAQSGLEACYIRGNFGVAVKGARSSIGRQVTALRIGNWVKQGLAFYSGHVRYKTTVPVKRRKDEHIFLRLGAFRGTGARVLVNGRLAKALAWPPYEADITSLVKGRRRVSLGIEILGHRRNSHGPLHHAPKWPNWTGPAEFISAGKRWREDYQLVPCGLLTPPELVLRRACAQ